MVRSVHIVDVNSAKPFIVLRMNIQQIKDEDFVKVFHVLKRWKNDNYFYLEIIRLKMYI